jgi:hypothetical protein
MGKRRTEVTEATERGLEAWGRNCLPGTPPLWCDKRTRGEHRTEATEVTEGGLGLLGECATGDTVGLGARTGVQPSAFSQSCSSFGNFGFCAWVDFSLMIIGRLYMVCRLGSFQDRLLTSRPILVSRPGVSLADVASINPNLPSVTSVNSVRCFPLSPVSRTQ